MARALTVKDVADQMACSTRTIRRLLGAGKVRAFRVGNRWRVQQVDLDQHIKQQGDPHPALTRLRRKKQLQ